MNDSGLFAWWPIIAATLAATAAIFSAVTAFLALRLNFVNSREAARPDLVIEEFHLYKRIYSQSKRPTLAAITFPLRNIGRGSALDVRIDGRVDESGTDDDRANTIARVKPVIPAGEESPLESTIEFFWPLNDNVFNVRIFIYYIDTYGNLYETWYRFLIDEYDGEGSVEGHAIDIMSRGYRRVNPRESRTLLQNLRPSHCRFAPVPMAHFFDLAHQRLEEESGGADSPSQTSMPDDLGKAVDDRADV